MRCEGVCGGGMLLTLMCVTLVPYSAMALAVGT